MDEPTPNLKEFSVKISPAGVEIWRETLAHLRHLSDDVWNGMKLFLSLNAFILAAIMFLMNFLGKAHIVAGLIFVFILFGLGLTIIARLILRRHRIYYLQMLAKKSLIETELGFYQVRLAAEATDLAFPWRLTPEVVQELKERPAAWIEKSIRAPGTIARLQFFIYEALIVFYVLILVGLVIALA